MKSEGDPVFAFVIAVFMFVVFGGLMIYGAVRQKKIKDAEWTGEIIDKNVREIVHQDESRENTGGGFSLISLRMGNRTGPVVTHRCELTIKTDTGEVIDDWEVTSGSYEIVKIGDKVRKTKGSLTIDVIEQTITQSQAPVESTNNSPVAGSSDSESSNLINTPKSNSQD